MERVSALISSKTNVMTPFPIATQLAEMKALHKSAHLSWAGDSQSSTGGEGRCGSCNCALHTFNFESRAHQEQLKGILGVLGVRELTGQDPTEGLLARGEDAIAALTGVVGSVVTRSDDEISLRALLLMDHRKTDILFAELLGSDDPQKIQEYFRQLYREVRVHGLAEEQIFYPALNPYYEQMAEIVD
jgi:hemerythrin superfamily protein